MKWIIFTIIISIGINVFKGKKFFFSEGLNSQKKNLQRKKCTLRSQAKAIADLITQTKLNLFMNIIIITFLIHEINEVGSYGVKPLLPNGNYSYRIIKISFSKKEGTKKKNSYARRVYESVDDESLS